MLGMPKSYRSKFFSLLLVGWAMSQSPVLSNDAALYDAPIPADRSLVRFLNVKLKSGVSVEFSGQQFEIDQAALSNYRIVGNGTFTITDGTASTEAKFEPGKFYTVAVGASQGGIVVIPDNDVENPSRSAISFYNFSSAPANLALRLNGDSKVLFKDLVPGAMASKELPVIDIGLEVTEGNKTVTEIEKVSLTARERQNVIVVDTANGPVGFVIPTGIDQ